MKILFFGDSIVEGGRDRNCQDNTAFPEALGTGFVSVVASELQYNNPKKYEIINRGIGGNGIVDLYNRVKIDCWNYQPDVISIHVGINDIYNEILSKSGVELDRFEDTYRLLIKHTIKTLPNAKIILSEPFVQEGEATSEYFDTFKTVIDYAKVVKKLAEEFNLPFVSLQKPLDEYAELYGKELVLGDGIHPIMAGCKIIAEQWLKTFRENIGE